MGCYFCEGEAFDICEAGHVLCDSHRSVDRLCPVLLQNVRCSRPIENMLKKAVVDPFVDAGAEIGAAGRRLSKSAVDLGRVMGAQSAETARGVEEAFKQGGLAGGLMYTAGAMALPALLLTWIYWDEVVSALTVALRLALLVGFWWTVYRALRGGRRKKVSAEASKQA